MNHEHILSISKMVIACLSLACFTGQSWAGELTAIASFNGDSGANPATNGVTLDGQGNLFGATSGGGANGVGTVWEIASGTSTITTLASFDSTNGASPHGGVILDAQGNLYGAAAGGGANGDGVVWEISRGSGTIATLATFNGPNGQSPFGLTMDNQGNFYGTTANGGTSNAGTVWEIASGTSTITTLASFNGSNGRAPQASVTLDAQGNLYGTTRVGGASNAGTVFEIAKGSGTITTLASFNGSNGRAPQAGVTLDAQGNLYGTTSVFSTVWEIAKGSGTITVIATFGNRLQGGVTLDGQGNLYGNTNDGGSNGVGSIWEIANGSGVVNTLASFDGTNGSSPVAGLTLGSGGNLYGTANAGGDSGFGTVFVLAGSAVPEPASLLLLGMGVLILVGFNCRRKSR